MGFINFIINTLYKKNNKAPPLTYIFCDCFWAAPLFLIALCEIQIVWHPTPNRLMNYISQLERKPVSLIKVLMDDDWNEGQDDYSDIQELNIGNARVRCVCALSAHLSI